MSMSIEKMRSLVSRLPDMKFKDRKKAVDRIERAGFTILARSAAYNMVRVGVPHDVMEHALLEELTEHRDPVIGDLIESREEADRLPASTVLIDQSSGDVYRRTFTNQDGESYYEVLGVESDAMDVEDFPLMIVWLPS